MCDPIKSIANRLRGLREVLELSAQEVAESCHLRVEEYMALESGESDISVNVLQTIARRYGISLDVLMFGEEPKMNAYFITRAGAGVSVERRKAYKYEALASGFRDRESRSFHRDGRTRSDRRPDAPEQSRGAGDELRARRASAAEPERERIGVERR